MELKVEQMGKGAGVRLPTSVLEQLGLDVGSLVDMELADGQLILRPKRMLTQEEILATCTADKTALTEEDREWLGARPVGKEIT
jgi:antitoxin component of MazEF toxin-antitoxin module